MNIAPLAAVDLAAASSAGPAEAALVRIRWRVSAPCRATGRCGGHWQRTG